MKTIYLAHPFNSRIPLRRWELKMEKKHKLKFINAFYSKKSKEVWKKQDRSNDKYYQGLNYVEIVNKDIQLIANADYFVAIINGEVSYGTIQEIVYAKLMGKMVFIICTNGHHNHPWLKYHANEIYDNFKDFEEVICHI